jgi:putative DNA primase/helicase
VSAQVIALQDWRSALLYKINSKGDCTKQLRSVVANAETVLVHDDRWRDVLAYDEFAESIVTAKSPPWRPSDREPDTKPGDWTDEDTIRVQCWLSDAWGFDVGPQAALDAVRVAARRHPIHPVRDWLRSLSWDGERRAPSWLVHVFGCDDTPYARAVGPAFLVACVARVMQAGCKVDTVPILEGAQGIGKSSALRLLCGDAWFLEMSVTDVANKDAMQVLRRKWIAELPEIDGLSRSETSHLKAYFSRQVDTYRPSYGKGSRDFPRQTCFAGTTNADQYLKDETGARRFWPIVCRRANLSLLEQWRDQLWAEAVDRFHRGEAWHITDPALHDEFASQQDARYRSDPWEQPIAAWLRRPPDSGQPHAERGVTTADVLMGALAFERARLSPLDAQRAAACLRRLGWSQSRQESRDGARVRPFRPYCTPTPLDDEPPLIEPTDVDTDQTTLDHVT